jgi:hypothetical protein
MQQALPAGLGHAQWCQAAVQNGAPALADAGEEPPYLFRAIAHFWLLANN